MAPSDRTAPPFVEDAHLLVDRIGYWPAFHDAEVRAFRLLAKERVLSMDIFVFGSDGTTDDGGYFKLLNPCVVTLEFVGIDDLEMGGWNHQNVINDLSFSGDGGVISVKLWPAYGLHAEFSCASARVMQVVNL